MSTSLPFYGSYRASISEWLTTNNYAVTENNIQAVQREFDKIGSLSNNFVGQPIMLPDGFTVENLETPTPDPTPDVNTSTGKATKG